jgi:hypothetical protein
VPAFTPTTSASSLSPRPINQPARAAALSCFLSVDRPVGSLWWQNYRLHILRQPIGTTGEWIVFAGWAVMVAAVAAAAFRSPLRAASQRIAAPFE